MDADLSRFDHMNSIHPSVPVVDGAYKRDFSAEIDCAAENELIVRGQLRDHRFEMSHVWRTRTPEYEILSASAEDGTGFVDTEVLKKYSGIAGGRVGRGFTRWVLDNIGDRHGSHETLLLAIEMARVAQQVYQFPPEFEARFSVVSDACSEPAHVAWLKDRAYMPDLANSCYTYRDASHDLFSQRDVRCGFQTSITRPRPGDTGVFWRRKQLSIHQLNTGGWGCESAMQDSVHDISVQFEMGSDGVVSNAVSRGVRLPYHGICEDAQLRTAMLNGIQLTPNFSRQLGETVGGESGCTHLFDLSIDCLRLFQF